MKLQNPINSDGPFWYRCRWVEFHANTSSWELSRTGRYALLEAYEKTPHRQLVEVTCDDQLRGFVRAWGPLRAKLDAWGGSDPIAGYRYERDRLALIAKLLASVSQPETQRQVLIDLAVFTGRDVDSFIPDFEIPLKALRMHFPIPGECPLGFDPHILPWLEGATQNDIQRATEILVSLLPVRGGRPGFMVVKQGWRSVVRASLGISSLGEALEWMVWQDVFQERRFQFCERCRNLFIPESHHVKKFCTERCARLVAARNWAKRKREKEAVGGAKKTR